MENKVLKGKILVAVNRVLKNNQFNLTNKIEKAVRKAIKKLCKK